MELHHTFRFKADSRDGLIALGIIVFGVVVIAVVLGTVALTRPGGQGSDSEVALNISARHGFDQTQDRGVQPPAGELDDRQ